MPRLWPRLCLIPRFLWTLLAWGLLAAVLTAQPARAGELVKIPGTRPDVRINVFWQAAGQAQATVLMFPGAGGGFGKVQNGWPGSNNFLVRTAPLWVKEGFNVAIFGRPSDMEEFTPDARLSAAHLQDIGAALHWVKQQSAAPVWIVGTSMGTISTAAALIGLDDAQIVGGVLTSSIVNLKIPGAVPTQALGQIRRAVLVYHHQDDACKHCQPHEVPAIIAGLTNAPIKKLMMVSGGANPGGPVCEALHWHGFIGMEPQAVADIAAWIRKPSP
ncbi:MAG: alpha/beta hydrolase [Pseudomonadota bacterium]|nr:alpha/beta hydrolase [Pseudomonadota bacterium]